MKDAYKRVVEANLGHAEVLQQLGWLYYHNVSCQNQDLAIQYLTKSLEAGALLVLYFYLSYLIFEFDTDPSDAQSWYVLGRAYMAGQKYSKAYEVYQQAILPFGVQLVSSTSRSINFEMHSMRILVPFRSNPYISEVWFNLGSLYESYNDQITNAIDAYARAYKLDPSNLAIGQRLQLLDRKSVV